MKAPLRLVDGLANGPGPIVRLAAAVGVELTPEQVTPDLAEAGLAFLVAAHRVWETLPAYQRAALLAAQEAERDAAIARAEAFFFGAAVSEAATPPPTAHVVTVETRVSPLSGAQHRQACLCGFRGMWLRDVTPLGEPRCPRERFPQPAPYDPATNPASPQFVGPVDPISAFSTGGKR